MANLASAVFLVVFVVFALQWLVHLPKVAIAAILIYTGFGLIDLAGIRRIWAQHRQTAWIALTTMASVVVIGVLPGILIGTAFSIAILLSQLARPHDALLGRVPASKELHDIGDDDKAEGIPGLVVYRFYGPLIFANVNYFIERLQGFIDREKHPVRQVLIDASAMPTMDYTALEKLRPFLENLDAQGVELAVARAHLPLRELNLGSDLNHLFPEERTFSQISDAVAAFKARSGPSNESE